MTPRILLSLALLSGCGGGAATEEAKEPSPVPQRPIATGPDVLLITLDTVRADRLGAYGYDKAITPHIDALAQRGRRFDAAYASIPLTIPAHAAIHGGQRPDQLDVRDNGVGRLDDSVETLAEVLHAGGWDTAAAVSAYVTTARWGFAQGFDIYSDDVPDATGDFWHSYRSGDDVVADLVALKELRAQNSAERPLFAWAHFYDAHHPYTPAEPWASQHPGRPYDGEISYVDSLVGTLVETFGEDTLVVVVADHGEALGSHGELRHGLYVYNATNRVPWIMAGPGIEPGVVHETVGHQDVMPTILEALGQPVPEAATGRSQHGSTTASTPQYLEAWQLLHRFGLAPHRAVVDGTLKLIDVPRPELYDVAADPKEENNLASDRPAEVERLQKLLRSLNVAPPSREVGTLEGLDEQLAALGYVSGSEEVALDDAPDPKTAARMLSLAQQTGREARHTSVEEDRARVAELARDYPHLVEFQVLRAKHLLQDGDVAGAEAVLLAAEAAHPERVGVLQAIGELRKGQGRAVEASAYLQKVAQASPHSPRSRTAAVEALLTEPGREQEALDLAFQYYDAFPEDALMAGLIGTQLIFTLQVADAAVYLEHGLRATPPYRDVQYLGAKHLLLQGDRAGALKLLKDELEAYPFNARAMNMLIELLGESQDWAGQIAVTEKMLAVRPEQIDAHFVRAQALYNLKSYDKSREALDRALQITPGAARLLLLDANLLQKEGKSELAKARFEEALAARAAYAAERAAK